MADPQRPLLRRGGLTGNVYVVLRYKDLGLGRLEAFEKHDVTEQYEALRAAEPADDEDYADGCQCSETCRAAHKQNVPEDAL